MNRITFVWLLAILVSFLFSCSSGFKTEAGFYKWINDPDNGMIKVKSVNGIKFTVKYLPPEYLAFKELDGRTNITKEVVDSVLNLYNKSRTFLLIIGPDEDKGEDFDIMKAGVRSYQEFKEKALAMNFDMAEYVTLKTELGEFTPVLTNMENVYGLSKHRTIYLVFAPVEENTGLLAANDLDLTFSDEIFNTGINHFVFKKELIDKLPAFDFQKITEKL